MALVAKAAALAALAPSALLRGAAPATSQSSVGGAGVALPEAIRAALARTAAQVSPITLRWTSRSRSMSAIEELAQSVRTDRSAHLDRMMNDHRHYRLTFQDGKYRASHHAEPGEPADAEPLHESAFDGEFMYSGMVAPPRDGTIVQSMYMKSGLAEFKTSEETAQYVTTEPFDVMGIRLPVQVRDLRAKAPVRSQILHMLEQGATLSGVEEVDLDGRKVVRLRVLSDDPDRKLAMTVNVNDLRKQFAGATTEAEIKRVLADLERSKQLPPKRSFAFYLDPALNYAIRRREEAYEPDAPISRTIIDGHEKLDDRDVYVARSAVTEYYSRKPVPAGQALVPAQTRTMEVTYVSGAPKPPETFALAYNAPGTRVYIKDANGRQTAHEVAEDGTLVPLDRRGRRRPPPPTR